MSCGEAVELISALLDGELGVSDTLRLQHHLSDCEACRAAQASEMWLHSLLAAGALSEQPPDLLRPRIQEHIAREAASALHGRAPWWRRALFTAVVSGALSVVAGGGLGESPILADAVAEHRQYSDAASPSLGITVADVRRLEQWIGSQLGLTVKLPAGAVRGAAPVGARVVAVAGRPAAQILYKGDGRHISLFVARKPSRPLPEEGEHIINGREVYTTTLGASNVGWWEDRRHLYLVVSSAQPEDLLALAELCMRNQRSRQARPPVPMQTQRRRVTGAGLGRSIRQRPRSIRPPGKANRRGA